MKSHAGGVLFLVPGKGPLEAVREKNGWHPKQPFHQARLVLVETKRKVELVDLGVFHMFSSL